MTTKLPFPFFLALFTTLFLALFYSTITNTAGVYIISELGGAREISIYSMVFFGLGNILSIPLAAPLAYRWGPIRLVVYGLILYSFFSICCGLAPTFFLFNLFRFGLGIASGLFYILIRKILLHRAPEEKVASYSFVMLLMYMMAPLLGACFGAWIAYDYDWRWIFHVNEIFALGIAAYLWLNFRRLDPPLSFSPHLDKIGYTFFALGISSLVTAATLSQELDWYRSPLFLTLVIVGTPSLLFFILWSLQHPTPILNLRLLRSPQLSYAMINLTALFSSYFGMIILIPLWLNIYANYTVLWISAILGVMVFSAFLGYLLFHTLLRHVDPRWMIAIAILCFIASCYYSTYFNVEVDFFHLAVARILSGSGLVLFFLPLFNLTMSSYGEKEALPLFTLFQVFRALASSLGAVLYVILWQRRQSFFHERLGEGLTPTSPLTAAYYQNATERFHLTRPQATEQLDLLLNEQATSLALNDAFACMGYICFAMLLLLFLSFAKKFTPVNDHPTLQIDEKGR